jgi:orotate phosphoribosyltransferase
VNQAGYLRERDIRQTLVEKGCLYLPELGHHFIGISGKHINGYCNIDPALPDVSFISKLCRQLVRPFRELAVDTVLVPAIGAIPLAQWGPYHLQQYSGKPVQGVWADKVKPRGFVIDRTGFSEALRGRRVLILEDMINQMFSVKELIRMTRELGGETVGVGALVANRTATREAMDAPKYERLCEFSYDAWDERDCPLCARRVPIVVDAALGHGRELRDEHPDYAGGFVTLVKD